MADELKQLPSSPVAALLRQAQEAARGVGDDESRSWWLRGPAKVADALIGRSPEHFDDIASGMFRLKRPSYQQSWAGANEPLVDALGITPTPDVGKAALLGGPMLKALGKTDEWRKAVDLVRRTGTPPPGWIVHPGKAAPEVSVMKYEATPWDDKVIDKLLDVYDSGKPNLSSTVPLTSLAPGSEVVAGYNKLKAIPPTKGSTVPKNDLWAMIDGTKSFGGSEAGYSNKGTIEAQLGRFVELPGGKVASTQSRPLARAALKSLLEHELTHAGQDASQLPRSMLGSSPGQFDPGEQLVEKSIRDMFSSVVPGPLKPNIKTPDDVENFAKLVRSARHKKMLFGEKGAFEKYLSNPGEAVARAMERLEFDRAMSFSPWSTERTNYELRRQMQQAAVDSHESPDVSSIEREMFQLWNKLEKQRQLRSTVKQQGPKP